MALAPARFLLPVRAVEPPHSSVLSSSSVCTGAYPHFSLFFFHPPSHRSSFSVSASVLEAQNHRDYKKSRHDQSRRHPDEVVPFDNLQIPYAESRFDRSNRDSGRARSAPRLGRGDANGSRRAWEPSNYPSWKKHGVSEGEVKARYNKPLGSQGNRNASLWTCRAENGAGDAYRDSLQQTRGDRKSGSYGFENRDMENNGYGRRVNAYNGSGSSDFFPQGASRYDTSRQGNFPETPSSWERSKYQENRGNPAWRPKRQYVGDMDRERHDSQRFASPNNSWGSDMDRERHDSQRFASPNNSWGSRNGSREEYEQQSDSYGSELGSRPCSPNGIMNLQPPFESSYPIQDNANEGRWQDGEMRQREEVVDSHKEATMELEGEQEQDNSSPISRIMQRLRKVDDRIPPLRAREGLQSRNEVADALALPSAREYLSDRGTPPLMAEQFDRGPVDTRFPWEKNEADEVDDVTVARARKLRPLSSAEMAIPGPELRRLRILAVHLKQRAKIGKHGVTNDLVNSIHQRFRTSEVVKVKCEGPPAGNMKKTLETLEEKTGGLIIWKAGSVAVLYRGQVYGQPVSEIVDDLLARKYQSLVSADGPIESSSQATLKPTTYEDGPLKEDSVSIFDGYKDATQQVNLDDASEVDLEAAPSNAVKQKTSKKKRTSGPEFENLEQYNMELEDILKDLGPRYEEWTGPKPFPVDADLLPSTIPNYTPPYRLLPFGMRANISNTIATHLRRLSRPLAPHFVLGRDRGLEGLAAAMVKLWEKSEIAKIGVKRGVLNTNQERIAEDLKQLTGGFFLCRDKYSMTFFRGKDFLPQDVAAALADRQSRAQDFQVEEERGRADGSIKTIRSAKILSVPSWVHIIDPEEQIRLRKEAAKARRVQVVAHLERKLKTALQKKEKAGRELDKVEELLNPVAPSDDKETLTDEERFMLRKLGLKMKAFLLVGRRGVFSGVVQNMHLHWKHRELVKIVIKERDPVRLNETARMLEAESGGTLISVDPTSKGFAIVVYRGKNYSRPPELRPPNLLTKRLALRRSLEMQRRDSLSRYISNLEEEMVHYRAGLNKMKMLDSSNEPALNEEVSDAHDSVKNDLSEVQQNQVGYLSGSRGSTEGFVQEISRKQHLLEDDEARSVPKISRRKLKDMCEIGPIFRAVRLSKTGRHPFRNEVMKLGKAPHFLVGRSNPMSTIAKAIRLHFLHHAFVKIGVSYRPRGTSVRDVVEELEDLTGGTAYAQDDFRVILYRGWPSGEDMPLDGLYDVLSPEQCDILEEEEHEDDEEDTTMEITLTQASERTCEEESDEGEDVNEGMLEWDTVSEDEDEDEDDDDDDDDDEVRSKMTLVEDWESSDDVEDDVGLYRDKFSAAHAESDDDDDDDDNGHSQWTMSFDGHAGDADDSRNMSTHNTMQDDDHDAEGGDQGHDHVKSVSVKNSHSLLESRFKEDVAAGYGAYMAGTRDEVGAGEVDEGMESFSIKESGDARYVKVDCGRFLAGASNCVGSEISLDFDLDEDV